MKRTPLFEVHKAAGAKMVDFGGWEMPVQYSSLLEEHKAVRTAAGLFDVSHMGEIEVWGREALKLVDRISTNDPSRLQINQAHYSGLLYEHGGFVDDMLVHRISDDHFFLCVNAANQEKDFEHVRAANHFDCAVELTSERWAQLALQGPRAVDAAQSLTDYDLQSIRYYWFADDYFAGRAARIACTGYTGEEGYEIYVAPEYAEHVWKSILKYDFVKPCGLGARNTLRLEAKMALYGHEIDATTTPYEADLAWIVKPKGRDFIGSDALRKGLERGIARKLVGFEMRGRGIGRDGYEVRIDGKPAGWVTSGSPSPTLNKNIGLCYLPVEHAKPGVRIEVMVRNQPVEAETVATPFYRRSEE